MSRPVRSIRGPPTAHGTCRPIVKSPRRTASGVASRANAGGAKITLHPTITVAMTPRKRHIAADTRNRYTTRRTYCKHATIRVAPIRATVPERAHRARGSSPGTTLTGRRWTPCSPNSKARHGIWGQEKGIDSLGSVVVRSPECYSETSTGERPQRRCQRTASRSTSGGNRNPANPEGPCLGGPERQLRFTPPPSPSRDDPSMQQCIQPRTRQPIDEVGAHELQGRVGVRPAERKRHPALV